MWLQNTVCEIGVSLEVAEASIGIVWSNNRDIISVLEILAEPVTSKSCGSMLSFKKAMSLKHLGHSLNIMMVLDGMVHLKH